MKRQMHIGLFLLGTGSHTAGWRYPDAYDTFQDMAVIEDIARIAERGKLDLIFMGDHLNADVGSHPSFVVRLEPLTMLAALSTRTTHIGLGATLSTTYSDPFTAARVFASLDHLSGGRAAWNAVTTANPAAAANFGTVHPQHARRYEMAGEFVDVVRGLWDCWDDDAIVADRETGVYVDRSKVRSLDHEGDFFKVKGPLHIGRAPQGHPVMMQAGGSVDGQMLAARTADVVFSVVQDFGEAKANYASLKSKTPLFGRDPDSVKLLPGVMPVVGRTDREAFEKLATLQGYVRSGYAINVLSERLGQDMSVYDLDGPIPDIPPSESHHGFAHALLSKAKRDDMKLRDLYNLAVAARGHWVLCGGPETIADTLQQWFEEGAADGFVVMPPYFPGAFDDFVDLVIPVLQERGLFRREYTGTTLRDHLGIDRPSVKRAARELTAHS